MRVCVLSRFFLIHLLHFPVLSNRHCHRQLLPQLLAHLTGGSVCLFVWCLLWQYFCDLALFYSFLLFLLLLLFTSNSSCVRFFLPNHHLITAVARHYHYCFCQRQRRLSLSPLLSTGYLFQCVFVWSSPLSLSTVALFFLFILIAQQVSVLQLSVVVSLSCHFLSLSLPVLCVFVFVFVFQSHLALVWTIN